MPQKVMLGVAYIFWIIIAWFFVAFYKYCFHAQIVNLSKSVSTINKEFIRFLVFVGPILLFILYNLKSPWYRWLGLYGSKKNALSKTLIVAIIYITIALFFNIEIFHKKADLAAVPVTFWFSTFSLSVIMEEIAFRGFLFYLFEEWNKNSIVIVTSLAFAVKHVPGWLFFPNEISPMGFTGDFIIIFLIGCILGKLYLATNSVWATSLVHSINNLIVELFR